MTHVSKSITIKRPRAQLFAFWRSLENLPTFMQHLQSVDILTPTTSHWTVNMPMDHEVEFDAGITTERPDDVIEWRSVGGT